MCWFWTVFMPLAFRSGVIVKAVEGNFAKAFLPKLTLGQHQAPLGAPQKQICSPKQRRHRTPGCKSTSGFKWPGTSWHRFGTEQKPGSQASVVKWKTSGHQVAELSQQLERECQKRTQLEATSQGLQDELSSLRGKWENLEKSKCQLQEELAKLQPHLETSVVDGSQILARLGQGRFGRALPTFATSALVAKEANARETRWVAKGTAERLLGWDRQDTILSALSSLFDGDPACVLKGSSSVRDSVSADLSIGGQSRPALETNVAKAEMLLQGVLVSPFAGSSLAAASGKFAIDHDLREACKSVRQTISRLKEKPGLKAEPELSSAPFSSAHSCIFSPSQRPGKCVPFLREGLKHSGVKILAYR
ncbi:uncharacterized protein LOC127463051 [Manacus candei]|uniref:uncharacterized protein LOC127463051 n=1 Tax=Manacus candei TaxID=415023 RepID=UPI0022275831|nr:uncharacterized protein LOC127463051 [Manacus candei]